MISKGEMAAKLLILLSFLALALAANPTEHLHNKLRRRTTITSRSLVSRDINYPEYNLSVPIDHFHNESRYEPHSNGTFNLRYWFDATYYSPGGPVFVLQSGETTGTDRLGFLEDGIVHKFAKAFGGIAVILEHRYYGTSMPTEDLSTENLRFLTTDQALADEAYFAQHVVFEGFENLTLTAPNTPYIGFGGSYAGAFNAILRKLYPDVFFGTISSSGVTEAIYDYWQYFEPIREYAPSNCIALQQKLTDLVDNILIGEGSDNGTKQELKDAFGLGNVTHNADFASVLVNALGTWQNKNWDPALNDPTFELYCNNLTSASILYPATLDSKATVQELIIKGGYEQELENLTTGMLNYIGYINLTQVSTCQGTQDDCFDTYSPANYEAYDLSQTWRSWPYQYCTEWGFLQTGSGVPKDQLPLLSRLLDIDYYSIICREAFNITTPPDLSIINKHGGFSISYPRLAIIDGEHDPWRPATPHASPFIPGVKNRTSTTSEPFHLIQGAVHHWDENGLFPNQTTKDLPPAPIKEVQALELQFVGEWLAEWKTLKKGMAIQQ